MDSKIKAAAAEENPYRERNISNTRNKTRKRELYNQLKEQRRLERIQKKKAKKQLIAEKGKDAVVKQIPKTIENQRVPEETMVKPEEDDEVMADQLNDELAPYFTRESQPKLLFTTSDKICTRTRVFVKQLVETIPNSELCNRRNQDLKKIIEQAIKRGYTDLIVVNEDRKTPNAMIVCRLPNGPTLHLSLSNVKIRSEIKRAGDPTSHMPEVILNNFGTRLGQTVGRLFASLFPHDPQFKGRRVVTFHNQRDYIFFRHHRYQFRNQKKVGLHELGPRFTMRLRSVQKGTFDSKYGEYEWFLKRYEMETNRRKFYL